jgi:hypothetical protein
MKKQTVGILVGGYIALSVVSWVGSQLWLKSFLKKLEEPQIEEISKEEEA